MTEVQKKPAYVMTAEEVLDLKIKEIPMLCSPILQRVGVASLCGGSDGGKSFLCLCIAIAICTDDNEIIGLKLSKKFGSVIIVCTEDTAEDICVRLTLLLGDRKLNEGKLRFIFESENVPRRLKEELDRQPADLVIMDTFGDLFSGNLNDSIEVRKFLRPYKDIAKDKKCLILFCHHIGKGKENNLSPNKNDVLGSQAIESACRTVLMLRKRVDTKRILTVVKGNNISEELKNKGMVLDFDPGSGFKPTGDTVNFDEQESTDKSDDPNRESLEKGVVDLYPELKSYAKVADALRKEGYKIDKNKVGKLWKENRPSVQNPKENDGTDDSIIDENKQK
jgi:archaellum biogenesis ATPase FlaH